MAILAVARDLQDLRKRPRRDHGRALLRRRQARDRRGPRRGGAMTVLLKDALKPNLIQTLEASPA